MNIALQFIQFSIILVSIDTTSITTSHAGCKQLPFLKVSRDNLGLVKETIIKGKEF